MTESGRLHEANLSSSTDPTNFADLISIFSSPRPNGSAAERSAAAAMLSWLERHGVRCSLNAFTQYPYLFECIGLWLILTRSLLAASIVFRWGWLSLPIGLIGLVGGLLDYAFHIPLISWPGKRQATNLLVEFNPPDPDRELVLTAHYDSKTEPLDHLQRMGLLYSVPLGVMLSLLLSGLGLLDSFAISRQAAWEPQLYAWGVGLSLLLLLLAWAMGVNLSLGRLLSPSQGSVDDGAACAILLRLAERLTQDGYEYAHTRLTIALFSGEEINLQGSRAYASSRVWDLPAQNLNLEAMAQDGSYIYWERDGSLFNFSPTSPMLNKLLGVSVARVSGSPPRSYGRVISDGAAFMTAGIPSTTLGTLDSRLGVSGFHRPTDNPARIEKSRLVEGVNILLDLLLEYDHSPSLSI